jgi:hypothetical protein
LIDGKRLELFPCAPPVATLISSVVPSWRSRTKMSWKLFTSPPTRSGAEESKATKRPSAVIDGAELSPCASAPAVEMLTRVVLAASRSRTKMSLDWLTSSSTSGASDSSATYRASELSELHPLSHGPKASLPSLATFTRVVESLWSTRKKTSKLSLVSPPTRLDANEVNAVLAPSELIADRTLNEFACMLAAPMLSRLVVPFCRSRTKTSCWSFVSPLTRLPATESKVTYRPSPLIDGVVLEALPWSAVPFARLTRAVVPVCRSWTKTSEALFVSPLTRFEAAESKET